MAFTFLKAKGYEIGKSLVDDEKIDYCKEMMAKAEKLGKKLLLPIDTTVAAEFPNPIDAQIEVQVVDADKIPADMEGLDIGTKTEIQKLVLDLADQGMAVAFISSEVEEMLRTCSRMAVLRDGEKVGELEESELSQSNIMKAIAGGDDKNE